MGRFDHMLAAANNGGMEIAERLLEPGGSWIERLILSKARAVIAERHEETRECFEIRRVVDRDLPPS